MRCSTERPIRQRTEGGFQLKAHRGTEVLSLATCEELTPADNHVTLAVGLSPAELSDESPTPGDTLIAAS